MEIETARRVRKADKRRQYRDARYGTGYDAFRTGLSFVAVRRMLRGMPSRRNPARFRDLTRSSVLGFWHEIKLQLWEQVQDARDAQKGIGQ